MKWNNKTIYISLFSILYFVVAAVSAVHAVSFFGLANTFWLGVILAIAFEIGQAAVLFSILTSSRERSKIMPWVLMCMFTLVQVLGNVYSSYKYVVNNSMEDLRYFKEPIFIWTEIPDNMANVIIVYLVGAILPISALLLTSMVTNYLQDDTVKPAPMIAEIKKQEDEIPEPEKLETKKIEQESEQILENNKEVVENLEDEKIEAEKPETEITENLETENVEEEKTKISEMESHFVNMK